MNFKFFKSVASRMCLATRVALMATTMVSCDKNAADDVVYADDPTIIGKWEGVSVDVDNNDNWIDITSDPHDEFYFTVEFREDGAFDGTGYLGNGSGTYMQVDNRITVYKDEAVYVQLQCIDPGVVQQELKNIKTKSEILLMESGTQIKK